jgi:predicted transglutaminase-like cysteine proteinase
MVWGLKTSVSRDVSAYRHDKIKVRAMTTAALGILFVLCAPGQITKTSYTSAINIADQQVLDAEFKNSILPELRILSVAKQPEFLNTNDEVLTTKSEIVSVQTARKNQKTVQLASLDLNIPEITKPRDFVPNEILKPPSRSPALRARPKLRKKLFGSVELQFEDERKIRAWSSVYERFVTDTDGIKECLSGECTDPVLANWANELRPLQNLSKFQMITAVNTLVNRRIYADDRRNYGRSDYWASPSEFLVKGGDCEDYAILKFASLLALGVKDQDMRLVVGRLSNGTPHAFLATNVGSHEYILDNRQAQVYLTTNRTDYVPKYSMNLSYRWSHVMPRSTTT